MLMKVMPTNHNATSHLLIQAQHLRVPRHMMFALCILLEHCLSKFHEMHPKPSFIATSHLLTQAMVDGKMSNTPPALYSTLCSAQATFLISLPISPLSPHLSSLAIYSAPTLILFFFQRCCSLLACCCCSCTSSLSAHS